MAKLTLNSALNSIRGRIDDWVYRRYGDRQILSRMPVSTGPTSPAQQAARDRFREAAAYARTALADPVRLPLYQAAAKAKGMPAFASAMGDFLNLPEVGAIDATGYLGRIGDPVKVIASDDFAVVGVDVVIRDDTAVVLEQGAAAFVDGAWTYVATVAVPSGETVTIEATAKDHPGHPGSLAKPWLIA